MDDGYYIESADEPAWDIIGSGIPGLQQPAGWGWTCQKSCVSSCAQRTDPSLVG